MVLLNGAIAIQVHVCAVDQPLHRRELEDLIWVARARQMDDAALAVDDEARRVRKA